MNQPLYISLSFVLILMLGFSQSAVAQNLVPNPSFEDTTSCPPYIGEFNVVDWISPNTGSPDLFHACSSGSAGVPQNPFGWQYPKTGSAYVGGHTSDFGGNNAREYIQCQLTSPMIAGEDYEVSFYVSRTDSSTKACDNLGAFLSVNAVSSSDNIYFNVNPQVVSLPNDPIVNDTGWVQIIDTITATTEYQFLTIGVFTDDVSTNWIPADGGWESEAHYYYDDVSVKQVTLSSISEDEDLNFTIYPNPVSDNLHINRDISEPYDLIITNSLGQILYEEKRVTSGNKVIDVALFKQGLLLIHFNTQTQSLNYKLLKQ